MMSGARSIVAVVLLAAAAAAAPLAPAEAMPMAPEECDRARTEQATLETSGVTADMANGAEWARANLGPDRLGRVARWIELQEQILFRCPRPKQPPGAITAEPREDGDQPVQVQKPRQQKSAQKPKPPAETAQQESGDSAVEAESAKPKAKPQVQKKPKAVDAYRPPAPLSGDEIQHPIPGTPIPVAPSTGLVP